MRCSVIRGKLKADSKFKCQTCAHKHTNKADDCSGIGLNGQSLEILEKFWHLGDKIGARGGVVDSVKTRIRCKFRNLVPLLASRGFPLEAKGSLYSTLIHTAPVILYGSETWPVKEEDVIRLESIHARMVRWMFRVRPKDRFLQRNLGLRPKLKSKGECLQDRRLQWFGHLGRMEGSGWSIKLEPAKLLVVY